MKTILTLLIKHFKDLVIGICILLILVLAYQWYQDYKFKKKYSELIGQMEDYEQIKEDLAKLEIQYKDQKTLLKLKEKEFYDVLKMKNDKIKSLSQSLYAFKKSNRKYKGHDLVYQGKRSYVYDEILVAGDDSPPIAWIMVDQNGVVRSGIYKFDFEVDNLQMVDKKTGRVKVYSKAYFVLKQDGLANRSDKKLKKWKDKKFPLTVKGGVAYVDPTQDLDGEKRKLLLAFRGGLGVDSAVYGGKIEVRPNVSISLAGYGKSKRDLDFKFVQIGVNTNSKLDDVGVDVKPVLYRPFKKLLPNTYVGAGASFSAKHGMGLTIGGTINF